MPLLPLLLLLLLLTLPPGPPRPLALLTFAAVATVAEEPIPNSEPQCPVPATPFAAPIPPGHPDPGDPDSFCFFTPQHPAAILEQSAPTHRFRPITVTAGRVGGGTPTRRRNPTARIRRTDNTPLSRFFFFFFVGRQNNRCVEKTAMSP